MSNSNFIQVYEYQKLRYSDDSSFKKHHFDSMVLFNEKNQNKYFTVIHNGIQLNSYVGVIQIGGLTIEILPKADNNEKPDEKLWQGVLLNMLKVCKHINVDNISETVLKKRYNSILDVYFELFLNEVQLLIKRGLIKQYRKVQSNQLALKGKLIFSKNIHKNLIHKERFFCEHQLYDKDHLIHQILYKALKVLDKILSNKLRDKLNRILFDFTDFKEVNISSKHFEIITINKKSNPYSRALDIAKMIILNYSPNLKSGKDNMLTLLFDMNKLWEEYIYRILLKHKPDGYSVSFQNSTFFWEQKKIKPDIVIIDKDKHTYVIDTKWKIIESNNPSDEDLKQMFTYNLHWSSTKSMLLYPKTNQEDSSFGYFHYKYQKIEEEKIIGVSNQCKVGFVSVLDNEEIKNSKVLSDEIFLKLK